MGVSHFLRIGSVGPSVIRGLLDRAQLFKERGPESWPNFSRRVVGHMFMEPSTRTMVGFQAAAARLGAASAILAETKYVSGMSSPEALEDTIRVLAGYCDVLVLRHPDPASVDRAAAVSQVPVINAGNGSEEHPSQAVSDLFAMKLCHGRLEGLKVGIVGDLAGSRSAHSLVRALAWFAPTELRLMSPVGRELPSWVADDLHLPLVSIHELDVTGLDTLYMAGLPEGDGASHLPESVRACFRVTPDLYKRLPLGIAVLCPLPRVDEIDASLDNLPGMVYFQQSANALFVRMAILEQCLGKGDVWVGGGPAL